MYTYAIEVLKREIEKLKLEIVIMNDTLPIHNEFREATGRINNEKIELLHNAIDELA